MKLDGVIGSNLEVNADDVIQWLKEAYDHQGTEAVILSINSPGGSPVQSGIINDEIKRYKVTSSRYSNIRSGRGYLCIWWLLYSRSCRSNICK